MYTHNQNSFTLTFLLPKQTSPATVLAQLFDPGRLVLEETAIPLLTALLGFRWSLSHSLLVS